MTTSQLKQVILSRLNTQYPNIPLSQLKPNQIQSSLQFYKIDDIKCFNVIKQSTDYLNNKKCLMSERIYHILNDLSERPKCIVCNENEVAFNGIHSGYKRYCSSKCANRTEEVRNKFKQTCLDKYGVEHAFQLEEFKTKQKQTLIDKYGVENISQIEAVKEKKKETCRRHYGADSHMKSVEGVASFKKSFKEKYGVDNPLKVKSIRDKQVATLKEKYGVRNISQYDKVKEKKAFKTFEYMYNLIKNESRIVGYEPIFELSDYKGVSHKYPWKCNVCDNEFEDDIDDGSMPRCSFCFPKQYNRSSYEDELIEFCKQFFNESEIKTNVRKILSGKRELDIYIPSINLAIEFNGIYWHTEKLNGDRNIHINKTDGCNKLGIQLIHIFEDEWVNKRKIVESMLRIRFNVCKSKIYARKCDIREVDKTKAKEFMIFNHLQTPLVGNYNYGLYFNNELVSVISISKPRFSKHYKYEILRFCSKLDTIVVGGLSKFIKYIERELETSSIITYVDRRFGIGDSYTYSGFKRINVTKPSYFYVKDNKKYNRLNFQKHLLKDKLKNYNPEMTEYQNMQLNGYDRIWDCGNFVYTLNR